MKWQGLGPTEPVRTEGGDLVGMLRRALDGIDRVGAAGGCGDVRAYFGIPYAAPPIGEARWCPPRPAAPWGGLRAAQAPAAQCVQSPRRPRSVYAEYSGDQPMSEDCLTLNVFSAAEPGEALPVMVWIHGGGHRQGAATNPVFTDGSLPCRGVVLVTINYRLGPLGFLCHPELMAESEHGACGNYALLDQIAALQWVSRNIAAFGGDPGCVTIFGQSAGGEAVGMLMASPLARGLFHRAGIMSLGATRTPQRAATQAEHGRQWGEWLGARSLAQLRALPAEALLARDYAAGYVVDGWSLPTSARDAFRAGRQADVPLIAGWTLDDGSVFGPPITPPKFEGRVRASFGEHADRVLALYPHADEAQAQRANQDLFRERTFSWPAYSTVRYQMNTGRSPAWLYHHRHPQPFRDDQTFFEAPGHASELGVFHSCDYPYLFGSLDQLDRPWTDADHEVSALLQGLWTRFAHTGDPNGADLPRWPAFDASIRSTLRIQPKPVVAELPEAERLWLFDELIGERGIG